MNQYLSSGLTLRQHAFDLLERGKRGLGSQLLDVFIIFLILVSVASSVLATVQEIHENHGFLLRLIDRVLLM